MAKLLHLNRPNRRVSNIVRTWCAMERQKRRRKKAQASQVPAGAVASGLVAHFGFGETGGNRVDDVAGYVLEPVDGPVPAGSGLLGGAVALTEYSYLLGRDATSAFCPTAAGFAVSVWVNWDGVVGLGADSQIVGVWDDGNWPAGSSWLIYSSTPLDGAVNVEVMGTGWTYLTAQASLNGWVHLCLVYAEGGGLWRLFVNGAQATSVEFDCAMQVGRLGVGGHTNNDCVLAEKRLDELAIWARELSAEEVAVLYNSGLGLAYPY
jgi:hypothetical protein